ncbi:MAG: hypothetical protein QM766_15330 [Burkholderiaceae bacterium]
MAREIRPDWWGKTSAGVILGFGLAVALVGLFAYLVPGGIEGPGGRHTLWRWLVPPIWIGVLSSCFLFRSGLTAWFWLGAANLIAFSALLACRLWFFA